MHITAFASGYTLTAYYFIMAYFVEMDKIGLVVLKVGENFNLTFNTTEIIWILN